MFGKSSSTVCGKSSSTVCGKSSSTVCGKSSSTVFSRSSSTVFGMSASGGCAGVDPGSDTSNELVDEDVSMSDTVGV